MGATGAVSRDDAAAAPAASPAPAASQPPALPTARIVRRNAAMLKNTQSPKGRPTVPYWITSRSRPTSSAAAADTGSRHRGSRARANTNPAASQAVAPQQTAERACAMRQLSPNTRNRPAVT